MWATLSAALTRGGDGRMGHMDLALAFSGFTTAIALRKERSDAAQRALSRWRHPVLVAALESWRDQIQRVKVP